MRAIRYEAGFQAANAGRTKNAESSGGSRCAAQSPLLHQRGLSGSWLIFCYGSVSGARGAVGRGKEEKRDVAAWRERKRERKRRKTRARAAPWMKNHLVTQRRFNYPHDSCWIATFWPQHRRRTNRASFARVQTPTAESLPSPFPHCYEHMLLAACHRQTTSTLCNF